MKPTTKAEIVGVEDGLVAGLVKYRKALHRQLEGKSLPVNLKNLQSAMERATEKSQKECKFLI